jgi:AcrR family transcriptional regulator
MNPAPPPPNTPFTSLPRKYGGASAEERKQQRRERLLEAAFEVFGRQGYKQTTLRMICAQARMTDRYFYEQFESLDEIFLAVRQRITADMVQMITQTLHSPEVNPMVRIRQALATFFEFMKSDPRRARIILLDAMSFGLTSTEVAKIRL